MSIIIQFNSPILKSASVTTSNQCRLKGPIKLEMVPGVKRLTAPGMTEDDNSFVDVPTSSFFSTPFKEIRSTSYCFGLPYQDHNYGAPPPPTPPSLSPCPSPAAVVAIANDGGDSTSTTEEAQEESITRCICGFDHDDGYMICCDNCLVWQHVDCMDIDRSNIPDTYLCDKCAPRKLDRYKARLLQAKKRATLIAKYPQKKDQSTSGSLYGKHKKKSHSQSGSSESEEDNPTDKNADRKLKHRTKRRRKEEDQAGHVPKKNKHHKHGKDKFEARRSKFRRSKNNKDSTSTADEEAQDAWQYNMEWSEENFESAVRNQYTSEVQHLARMVSPQGHESKFYEQLQLRQCHIMDDCKVKKLVCLYDIPRNQPLIEYRGKFLMASEFHDIHPLYNKKLYPFVMFYMLGNTEICVDASIYGNDARFVRKSCKPNAEIRHMIYNGNLHLFLQSTKVIFSEDEVTVPLNLNQNDNLKDVECACGQEDCIIPKPKKKPLPIEAGQEKRTRRSRRITASTAEEDSSQSVILPPVVEKPPKPSPVKPPPPKVLE